MKPALPMRRTVWMRPATRARIFGHQLFGGLCAVIAQDVREWCGEIETLAERPVTQGFNLAHARGALFKQFVFQRQYDLLWGNQLL